MEQASKRGGFTKFYTTGFADSGDGFSSTSQAVSLKAMDTIQFRWGVDPMDWPQKTVTSDQSNIKWALKVLFVGDEGVGKTDLMCGVSDGVYIDGLRYKLGSSFGAKQVQMEPARVQLQIWNLTDSPAFTKLRRQYYRGSAGVVYVFSLTDRASFDNIIDWVDEVRRVLGEVPSLLVGTRRETQKKRRVTKREAKMLAKHLAIPYLEVGIEPDPHFEYALQDMVIDILRAA